VFHNVRHFEQFTQLELGMLAETKRTSLPRLAKTVQGDHQALHHLLANSWPTPRGRWEKFVPCGYA
jgi:SRSO17 transposase